MFRNQLEEVSYIMIISELNYMQTFRNGGRFHFFRVHINLAFLCRTIYYYGHYAIGLKQAYCTISTKNTLF